MSLAEKMGYLRGLADGLNLDEAKDQQGKLLAALVDVVEELADQTTANEEALKELNEQLDELTENTELEATDRYKYQAQMQKNILAVDKQLQTKRRMMLDIEKECAMTISAAMRSIPKTTAEPKNPLMGILNDDDP
mgnify:CR=1 FL=1